MILWIAISYLSGSIPFGLIIARAKTGKDVRTVGSGNIGATNVARAAGRPAAILTLVLDALKGLAPVLAAARWAPGPPLLLPSCAIAAVIGHCFPLWLKFRGGKGVATGLGVSLALAPWAALAGGLTWLTFYKLLRISSVGSIDGAQRRPQRRSSVQTTCSAHAKADSVPRGLALKAAWNSPWTKK